VKDRLQLYLPPSAIGHLRRLSACQQITMSAAARKLLLAALAGGGWQPPDRAQSDDRATSAYRPCRVHVRLSQTVYSALEVQARDFGQTPAAWTAALLAHLLIDQPLQRRDEVLALREATRQLAAVGVLLNQVTRAVNTKAKAAGFVDPQALPLAVIERCLVEIRSTTGAARRVLDTNRQPYRYADAASRPTETAHA
jgi:hypothetical protein